MVLGPLCICWRIDDTKMLELGIVIEAGRVWTVSNTLPDSGKGRWVAPLTCAATQSILEFLMELLLHMHRESLYSAVVVVVTLLKSALQSTGC